MQIDNIIVGIDPGTTTAYAIMNLRTLKVYFNSERELGINELIRKIFNHGFVVAVGSDKKPCPVLVEKFASKTGSKLIVPKENLNEDDKKRLSRGFKFKNSHERDAIAALNYAFKTLKPLLRKIDLFLENKEESLNSDLKSEMTRLVLSGRSVKEAFMMIKESNNNQSKKKIYNNIDKSVLKMRGNNKKTVNTATNRLSKKYEQLLAENKILRQSKNRLLAKLKMITKFNNELLKRIDKLHLEHPTINYKELVDEKEELSEELNKLREKLINKEEEIRILNRILSKANSGIVLKRFNTLLKKEFENKKRLFGIEVGDVILVNNPNEYSQSVIKELQNKVTFVFYEQKPTEKTIEKLNFTFLDINKIPCEKTENFALIKRPDFERVKKKTNFINRIIKQYRRNSSNQRNL